MSAAGPGRRQQANQDGRILVQVRIPKELVKRLDHFCIDRDVFRAEGYEILLTAGLTALEAAREGQG